MYDDDDTFDEADFYGTAPAKEEDPLPDDTPEPDEVGQGDDEDNDGDEPADADSEAAEPTPDYLDPTTFGDKLVKLKVDGEEIEVPLKEALSGYQRQADYTRKTQEVAFWKQVDAAMKADPRSTLEYLAKTYGVEQATAIAQQAAEQQDDDDWGYDDPKTAALKAELEELKQLVQPVVQSNAEAYLTRTVEGLIQKYGDDFNPTDVITEAVRRGIHDPSKLESVFRDMAFDTFRARAAAQSEFAAQSTTKDQQRRQAAAAAAAVTGAGGSASGAGIPKPTRPQPRNPREAILAAFEEVGG